MPYRDYLPKAAVDPYKNLSPFQRAMERPDLDPFGADLQGKQEQASLIGTKDWAQKRINILKKLHADEIKMMDESSTHEKDIGTARIKQLQELKKLEAENTKAIWEYKLTMAETYTGRMETLFDELRQVYGKENKSLFLLSKAASVATIAVKTAQGIMTALGEGGLGWPMALLIAAEGSAQMSVASAATMARGGLVPGYSPSKTADNIPLRGTAGEFMHPVDSVNYYGADVHEAMRQKLIPRELFSGLNLPNAPALAGSSLAGGGLVGGAGKTNFTILNYVDRQELLRALATPEGKDAVFNLLSSNPVALRRIMRG